MPLGRPVESKEQANAQKKLAESLYSRLDGMTPWLNKPGNKGKSVAREHLKALRSKVASGTIAVIPDGQSEGALMDTLYKDATIIR